MKVAIGLDENGDISQHFGRAHSFMILDSETKQIIDILDNSEAQDSAKGAGIAASALVARAGVKKVYSGMIGPKAIEVLNKSGIGAISGVSDIEDAIANL